MMLTKEHGQSSPKSRRKVKHERKSTEILCDRDLVYFHGDPRFGGNAAAGVDGDPAGTVGEVNSEPVLGC